jgi:hypothetical protein
MAGHHAAGAKMLSAQSSDNWFVAHDNNVVYRRCVFRRNVGPGFWQDYGGKNLRLEHCLIEDNESRGISNEMTFGSFTVKNCVIRNNGSCNVQAYGSSNMTFDGCVMYGAKATQKPSEPKFVANFLFKADARKNDGHPADIRNHTIINCVIVATRPQTCLYRIIDYGRGASEHFGKLPYLHTLTSDYNRWYRRDQESMPWPYAFMGTRTFPGAKWKEAWPDMTWDEYRAIETESGNKLDEHSTWGDVDCERVADSVLELGLETTTSKAIADFRTSIGYVTVRGNLLSLNPDASPVTSILITDAQGRTVYQRDEFPTGKTELTLPTTSARLLFIRVQSGKGRSWCIPYNPQFSAY